MRVGPCLFHVSFPRPYTLNTVNRLCMEYFSGSEMLDFRLVNFLGGKKVVDYLAVLTSYFTK